MGIVATKASEATAVHYVQGKIVALHPILVRGAVRAVIKVGLAQLAGPSDHLSRICNEKPARYSLCKLNARRGSAVARIPRTKPVRQPFRSGVTGSVEGPRLIGRNLARGASALPSLGADVAVDYT